MSTKHKNIGQSLDDFLKEEGILEEAEEVAVKRVLAYQIEQLMKEQGLTKTAMARQMETSRSSLDRLLDPRSESVTLQTLGRAANVLGKRLSLRLI
jgi:antitoxin HicB